MNKYMDYCLEAVADNLSILDVDCQIRPIERQPEIFTSQGVMILMGIAGIKLGRIIIDMSTVTAEKLAEKMNDEEVEDEEYLFDTIGEFGNIVSGHVITKINNDGQGLKLMLAPPNVFSGACLRAVSPKLQAHIAQIDSEIGSFTVSVGFEGGK
jgi:CheY-specific phosphatase CheX